MIKKTASIILILALLTTLCVPAASASTYNPNAEQNLIDQQIAALLEQRQSLMFETPRDESAIEKINSELEELGVEFLTDADVASKFPDAYELQFDNNNSSASPRVSTPSSSSVSWMSTRSSYVFEGQIYNVQKLIAEPLSESCSLWREGSARLRYTGNAQAGAVNFFKAVGAAIQSYITPVTSTLYNIFSSTWNGLATTTIVDSVDATLSWETSTTVMIYYIRLESQTDEAQRLAFITSSCYTSIGYVLDDNCTYINANGDSIPVPSFVSGNVSFRTTPSGYNNTQSAVIAYKYYPYDTIKDTVLHIYIYGPNDTHVTTVSPCDPNTPGACG